MSDIPETYIGNAEAEMILLRHRHEAAQRIADKLGVSVGRVFVEWRDAEINQKKWMETLSALGYKAGDDPLDFLRRVNKSENS